jgi:hypothetical protein
MSSSVQARFDETMARADDLLRQRLKREEQELARQDGSLEDARRAKMRQAAEERRQIQAVYADAFASFGTEVPAPVDDEPVPRYRARLFNRIVRRLPQTNEWSSTRADDIPAGPAMDTIERLVIESAQLEGQRPSFENLPDDGSMIMRTRVDDMGEKSINWYGKESFIKSMGRPGRRSSASLTATVGRRFGADPFDRAR